MTAYSILDIHLDYSFSQLLQTILPYQNWLHRAPLLHVLYGFFKFVDLFFEIHHQQILSRSRAHEKAHWQVRIDLPCST